MEASNLSNQKKGKIKKFIIYSVIIYLVLLVLVIVGVLTFRGKDSSDTEKGVKDQFTRLLNRGNLRYEFSGELVPTYAPTLGPADAKVTIVEFSDFECPFCKASFLTIRSLLNEFPDDVRLVYRHFPLRTIHPLAQDLAHASMCAHDQGKFWAFHDQLFIQQESVTRENLDRIAQQVGLDTRAFRRCQDSNRFKEAVDADFADAVSLGGRGTPTWVVNGGRLEGVLPIDIWRDIVRELL